MSGSRIIEIKKVIEGCAIDGRHRRTKDEVWEECYELLQIQPEEESDYQYIFNTVWSDYERGFYLPDCP